MPVHVWFLDEIVINNRTRTTVYIVQPQQSFLNTSVSKMECFIYYMYFQELLTNFEFVQKTTTFQRFVKLLLTLHFSF